jgi:hypothetical protein
MIRDQGFPCAPSWLEFHERYAGYVEVIGRDVAIWGLVHANPQWMAPRQVDVDGESDGKTWYITSADVHPSYVYRLDQNGEFLGGPAQSFDIHVERVAAFVEFQKRQHCRPLSGEELRSSRVREMLAAKAAPSLLVEASDAFFNCYVSRNYLLVVHAPTGALRNGFVIGN